MAQTTYASMFVWTILTSFWHFDRKKKKEEEERRTFTITRPVGFAAGKKSYWIATQDAVALVHYLAASAMAVVILLIVGN